MKTDKEEFLNTAAMSNVAVRERVFVHHRNLKLPDPANGLSALKELLQQVVLNMDKYNTQSLGGVQPSTAMHICGDL